MAKTVALFLFLALASASGVELLKRAELDACMMSLDALPSAKKMHVLGHAWNEMKPDERVPVLNAIALIEGEEAEPDVVNYLANLKDDSVNLNAKPERESLYVFVV